MKDLGSVHANVEGYGKEIVNDHCAEDAKGPRESRTTVSRTDRCVWRNLLGRSFNEIK